MSTITWVGLLAPAGGGRSAQVPVGAARPTGRIFVNEPTLLGSGNRIHVEVDRASDVQRFTAPLTGPSLPTDYWVQWLSVIDLAIADLNQLRESLAALPDEGSDGMLSICQGTAAATDLIVFVEMLTETVDIPPEVPSEDIAFQAPEVPPDVLP